jgi:hypothetical protein
MIIISFPKATAVKSLRIIINLASLMSVLHLFFINLLYSRFFGYTAFLTVCEAPFFIFKARIRELYDT